LHTVRNRVTNRRTSQTATDNSWWSYPANTTTTTIGYTANNLNQYSQVGAAAPTGACPRAGRRRDPGDANGNLTYEGVFTYGYDAENRLVSVKQGAATVASYAGACPAAGEAGPEGRARQAQIEDGGIDDHAVRDRRRQPREPALGPDLEMLFLC